MAVRLVKIVNANGNTGWVAETYPPLVSGDLRRAPSQAADEAPAGERDDDDSVQVPIPVPADELPPKRAPEETWREFGASHGLPPEQVDDMSAKDIRAQFTKEK